MFNFPFIRKPNYPSFDEVNYDDYWRLRGWKINEALKNREKVMLSLIPEGSKVLDIGCGNSRLPLALAEKGVDITVADVSDLVLSGYAEHHVSSIRLDLERIQEAELKHRYDFIIMSEVLEHLKLPEAVIHTLSPYTERFLLTVPNSASYQFRYGLMFRGRFFTQWVYHPSEHLRYWSHIDFLDWLEAMGLTVEKTIASDGFTFRDRASKLPNLWKNLLAFRVVYQCRTEPKSKRNYE